MLQPFDWAVLTVDDALLLKDFITKATSDTGEVNYRKLQELGVLDIYQRLRDFIHASEHYRNILSNVESLKYVL